MYSDKHKLYTATCRSHLQNLSVFMAHLRSKRSSAVSPVTLWSYPAPAQVNGHSRKEYSA